MSKRCDRGRSWDRRRKASSLWGAAALVTWLAVGCSAGAGGEEAQPRAALVDAKGVKVTISGLGPLDQAQVRSIAGLLESKGEDVDAAIVRLIRPEEGDSAATLEISLWGAKPPIEAEIEPFLRSAAPELGSATIVVEALAPGGAPAPATIVTPDPGLSAQEAKAEIEAQLAVDGLEGEVQVEDGPAGRRVEVRVEKTLHD